MRPILRLAQSLGTKPLRVLAWSSGSRNCEDAGVPGNSPGAKLERLLAEILAEQDDLVPLEDVAGCGRDQLPGALAAVGLDHRERGIGKHGPVQVA